MLAIAVSMVVAWAIGFAVSAIIVLPFAAVGQVKGFARASASDFA